MNGTTENGKAAQASDGSVRGLSDGTPVLAVDAPDPDQLLTSRQRSVPRDLRTLERRGRPVAARRSNQRHVGSKHYQVEKASADVVAQEMVYVPLLGRIVAGRRPIVIDESIEDIFPLPRQLVGGGALFLLQVTGDSMINAAIADGDFVVVREQPDAEDDEIVAAMIDEDVTIKTLRRSDNHVWLMPQNPVYPRIEADEALILGKVVAVIRRL